ncbi:peroxisome biogenesis factor 10, partial [Asbolus verrucosus]
LAMQFSEASVADVLRSAQRDENFVREMQGQVEFIGKLLGVKNYHGTQRIVPALTNAWYYFMTTLGNLQTLGEEYTGTLRLDDDNRIPTKLVELMWLALYIGGEPLFDRFMHSLQTKIKKSNELTEKAKTLFLKILDFTQQHKQTVKRIHHSLFYINGKYYNISNRAMGIKYVLVRQWLQDDTFTRSFKLLGHLSLFYVLFNFVQQIWSSKNNGDVSENVVSSSELSWKVIDEELKAREEEIERKRNKSRLKEPDRNFLYEKNPYPEPAFWHHGTLKYMRRLYGRYGAASGVDPSVCWPVKQELEEALEYERVAYPFTIPQMIEDAKKKRSEKNERVRLRQEEIVKKMEKLEDMKRELYNKIRKKETEAKAAKDRKERLIEEVRMHFGYTVDPRDEKFKEMLEKKEKEQKKALKEERRKAREETMLARMLSKKTETSKEKAQKKETD